MSKGIRKFFCLLTLVFITNFIAVGQKDSCRIKTNITADIVSTYIWRGIVSDQSPNIQPGLSATLGGFTLGAWASNNFTGTYKEVDLYASYNYKRFTCTVTDYQWSPMIDNTPYFEYNNDKTGHIFEAALLYTGGDKFPLKVSANTMFYGADKKVNDKGELENQYSTYFEALYPFQWKGNTLDAFLGFTPQEGYYGNGMGVVNMGFTGYKTVKITDAFSLPLKGSLVFNPQASRTYFILTISM
jgi:hypothetical protein